MTGDTANLFDALYDLLRRSRPNLGQALALVEQKLQQGVCLAEQKAAQDQLIKILVSLKQFYSKNQKAKEQVAELIRIIETEGMLDLSVFKDTLRRLLPKKANFSGSRRDPDIPASFNARIAQLFAISEVESASSEVFNMTMAAVGAGGSGISSSISAVDSEKEWQFKLLMFGRGLSDAYRFGHLVDAATTRYFAGNRVDGTRHTSQKLETMVRNQLLGFHRIAGSLKASMEDGREKVKQLKHRVDQLEEAITLSQKSLFIDPDTAIPGRASFTAHLHRHLERALHLGELFSMALVHIPDFEKILQGLQKDEEHVFVRTLASLIRSQLDSVDFLARLGVDRFVVIYPKTTQERSAEVTNNIGVTLNSTAYRISTGTIDLHARVGAISFESGMTAQDMLALTDKLAESAVEAKAVASSRTVLNVREA